MNILDVFSRRSFVGTVAQAQANAPALPQPWDYVSPWSDSSHLAGLEAEGVARFFGIEAQPVTRAQAMTIPPVAKARHLLTGAAGRLPLRQMTGGDPSPRPAAWIDQPEHGRPRSQTILWTVDALIFHGRSFWLIDDRTADGRPARFQWVPEHRATVDPEGRLVQAFDRPVSPEDWIRFDGPHEGALHFAADTFRDALALARAAGNAAQNPVPSIDLHQTSGDPLTDEEIDSLLARWRAARTARGGGVAFTSKAVEARTQGQPPEQLLINARNASALDAARCLGIPAWAVDAAVEGSSMTYSNTTSRFRELLDFGLRPYLDALTDRLSMDDVLAHGVWCRFDPTDALRPTFTERMEGYATAISAGVFTAAECRAMEDQTPLEEARNDDDRDETARGLADNGPADRDHGGGGTDLPDDHRADRGL